MAQKGTDTARFVITGEFRSADMIAQAEASIGQLSKMISKKLGKVGTEVSAAVNGGIKEGTGKATKDMAKNMKGVKNSAAGVGNEQDKISGKMDKINADIFTAVKRVVLWGAASRVVYQTFGQIQDSIKDVIELNRILVNIQKIRPAGLDVQGIGDDIINKAKRFGVAFEEIGETQRTFFQQGFKTAEVAKLTEAQLLGVTAAGLTASEAMELLVGSMTIFDIEASHSISLIDKLQKVQANYAVSTQDLATAMRRVGPVAEQLGGDIDHLIGIITSLKTSTRKSGEFIGTALSTIFSRTITDVGANQLRRIGVDINETAQTLRPLKDIFDDIADSWVTLTDQEKISTAFALGARRRYAQVIALFNEYSTVVEASATATNAFGAALIAQQIEVQSVSRQFAIAAQAAREAGLAFIKAFSNTGSIEEDFKKVAYALITFQDLVTKNAKVLSYFAKTFGFVSLIVALQVSIDVLGKRIASLTVGATMGSAAMTAFKTATAANIGVARALAVAYAAINWPSLIASVLIASAAWAGVNFAMRQNIDTTKELDGVYDNFGKTTEKQRKKLSEYLEIVKQFNEVGGPASLVDFLGTDNKGTSTDSVVGNLRAMEGVSKNLENVDFAKFQKAMSDVRGETVDMQEAFYDLSQIIGFTQATSSGFREELEEFSSEAKSARIGITELANSYAKFLSEGSKFSEIDVLKDAFGGETLNNLDALLKKVSKTAARTTPTLEETFNSIVSSLAETGAVLIGTKNIFDYKFELPKAPDVQTYDEYFEEVRGNLKEALLNGEGKLAELSKTGGIHGKLFAEGYYESLQESLLKVPDTDGIFDFVPTIGPIDFKLEFKEPTSADLQKAYEAGLANLDPKAIEQYYLEKFAGEGINIEQFLLNEPDPGTIADIAKGISDAFDVELPDIFKRVADEVSPLTQVLLNLQKAARRASGSAGFLSKNITTTFKNFVTHTADTGKLAEAFRKAGYEAQYFGKSLTQLDFRAITSQLKASTTQLAKIDALEEQVKSINATREAYEEYIKELEKDPKITGLKLQKAYQESDRLAQKSADLAIEQGFLASQAEKLREQIKLEAEEYANLFNYMQQVETAYAAQNVKINQTAKARLSEIKALETYSKSLNKVQGQISKLGTGGSFDEKLSLNIKEITLNYAVMRKSAEDVLLAEQNRARALGDTLKYYHEYNSAGTNLVNTSERVLGANLELNKSYRDSLRNQEKSSLKKVEEYKSALLLLDAEEARAKSLAGVNSQLDREKALHKANLDIIKAVISSIEESASVSADFSRNIAQVSASFARLDSGGSFAKDLRTEQALIRKETEITTREIDKQIDNIKQEVLLKQNALNITSKLTSLDSGRSATMEQLKSALDSMDLSQKKGLNTYVLAAKTELLSLELKLKNLAATEKNNLAVARLNTLLEIANSLHKSNLDAIKNYASGIRSSISATEQFNSAAAEIASTFQLLGTSGEFAKGLQLELNGITSQYEIQRNALKANVELTKLQLKEQQKAAGYYDDILLAELNSKGLLEEQLSLRQDLSDEDIKHLNSIAIAGRSELDVLDIKIKQLSQQKEYDEELARMNTLLELAKRTHGDMNSLAAGYATAVGDIVKNIGDIVSERGGLRTILEPFADAYISSVTNRLSTSLQSYFDNVLESSVGGKLATIEAQLKKRSQAKPYEIGGELLKSAIVNGSKVAGDIIKNDIINAAEAIRVSADEIEQTTTLEASDAYNQIISAHTTGADIVSRKIIEASAATVQEINIPSNLTLDVGNAANVILDALNSGASIISSRISSAISSKTVGVDSPDDISIDVSSVSNSILDAHTAGANIINSKISSAISGELIGVESPDSIFVDVSDAASAILNAHRSGADIISSKVSTILSSESIKVDAPDTISVDIANAATDLLNAHSSGASIISSKITSAINNTIIKVAAPDSISIEVTEAANAILDAHSNGASLISSQLKEVIASQSVSVDSPGTLSVDVAQAANSILDAHLSGAAAIKDSIISALSAQKAIAEVPDSISLDFDKVREDIYRSLVSGADSVKSSIDEALSTQITADGIPETITLDYTKVRSDMEKAHSTGAKAISDSIISALSTQLPEYDTPDTISLDYGKIREDILEAHTLGSSIISKNIEDAIKTQSPDAVITDTVTLDYDKVKSDIEQAHLIGANSISKGIISVLKNNIITVDAPDSIRLEYDAVRTDILNAHLNGASAISESIASSILATSPTVNYPEVINVDAIQAASDILSAHNAGSSIISRKIAAAIPAEIPVTDVPKSVSIDTQRAANEILSAHNSGAIALSKRIGDAIASNVPAVDVPRTIKVEAPEAANDILTAHANGAELMGRKIGEAVASQVPSLEVPNSIEISSQKARLDILEAHSTGANIFSRKVAEAISSQVPTAEIPNSIYLDVSKASDDIQRAHSAGADIISRKLDTILSSQDIIIDAPGDISVDVSRAATNILNAHLEGADVISRRIGDSLLAQVPSLDAPDFISVEATKAASDVLSAHINGADLMSSKVAAAVSSQIIKVDTPSDIYVDAVRAKADVLSAHTTGADIISSKIVSAISTQVPTAEIPNTIYLDVSKASNDILTAHANGATIISGKLDSILTSQVITADIPDSISVDVSEAATSILNSHINGAEIISRKIGDSIVSQVPTLEVPDSINIEATEAAAKLLTSYNNGADVISDKLRSAISSQNINVDAPSNIPLTIGQVATRLIGAFSTGAEIVGARIVAALSTQIPSVETPDDISVNATQAAADVYASVVNGGDYISDKIISANAVPIPTQEISQTVTVEATEAANRILTAHITGSDIISSKIVSAANSIRIQAPSIEQTPEVDSGTASIDIANAHAAGADYMGQTITASMEAYKNSVSAGVDVSEINSAYASILSAHTNGAQIVYDKIIAAHSTFRGAGGVPELPQSFTPLASAPVLETGPITDSLTGVTTGIDTLGGVGKLQLSEQELQAQQLAKQVDKQRLTVAAIQGLGVIMGNIVGGGGEGSQIGASIGGIGGSFLGPVGAAIGSTVGGLIGGLFDEGDEPEPEPIPANIYEANSDALRSNTEALIRNSQNFDFMRRLLNAPANFIQPAFAGVGGGANITVQINAPVGNENAVGQAVYDAVSKVYSNDYRRIGRRG